MSSIDILDEIVAKVKSMDRNLSWLSRESGIEYNTLYATLKKRLIKLTPERLELINKTLGTDFKL